MSHNYEPEKAARRHKPAIIGIIVALLVALAAFLVFSPGAVEDGGDGIATTPPPAGVTSTEAAGTEAGTAAPVAPDAGTPADAMEGGDGAMSDPATPAAPAN
ncbi:MAG: hypothetical protein ACK41U_18595 [Paracoccus sp. (in: a-proteobacteria)]|uniref:hypothetical protein n=1 Tax=Paracoccus sp. TaxID=267 RepID=UPI00391D4CB1